MLLILFLLCSFFRFRLGRHKQRIHTQQQQQHRRRLTSLLRRRQEQTLWMTSRISTSSCTICFRPQAACQFQDRASASAILVRLIWPGTPPHSSGGHPGHNTFCQDQEPLRVPESSCAFSCHSVVSATRCSSRRRPFPTRLSPVINHNILCLLLCLFV